MSSSSRMPIMKRFGNLTLEVAFEITDDDIQIWPVAYFGNSEQVIHVPAEFTRESDLRALYGWCKDESERLELAEFDRFNHVDYIDDSEDSDLLSRPYDEWDYQEYPEDYSF